MTAANDVTMLIPILEMAGNKVSYHPEVTYIYNENTGSNTYRVKLDEQAKQTAAVRYSNQKYDVVEDLGIWKLKFDIGS